MTGNMAYGFKKQKTSNAIDTDNHETGSPVLRPILLLYIIRLITNNYKCPR